nr:CaiB/BaiF CoA-transferase family protein [Luteithermobacter gelatinilyticus]
MPQAGPACGFLGLMWICWAEMVKKDALKNEDGTMNGPLSHVRVVDLSRVLAGPWATQMLGDLGAEVIKIEQPASARHPGGDDTRGWGPPFLENADGTQGDAAYFLCANRNKDSRAIDFTTAEGQAQVRDLVRESDVVVENFKVGGLKKYGLDYDSLKQINPGLIYCSITGFGQSGPYAARPGYDFLIQGMGGLMSLTGSPESGPQKVGVAIADLMTGMYASVAIVAALNHKERTGEGQHIDLALLDCQVAMLANQNMNYLIGGTPPGLLGNAHPNIVPYEAFATKDGHLILAVGNDGQFARFAALIGRDDWAADSRFKTNAARVQHRDLLIPLIGEVLREKTTADWIAALEDINVPCGPVNRLDQVFEDPQVKHRGLLRELMREDGTCIPTVANPIKFSRTPVTYRKAPPKKP